MEYPPRFQTAGAPLDVSGAPLAEAVPAANIHSHGIVHFDLDPQNGKSQELYPEEKRPLLILVSQFL